MSSGRRLKSGHRRLNRRSARKHTVAGETQKGGAQKSACYLFEDGFCDNTAMAKTEMEKLRAEAVARSFFKPADLKTALEKMLFVQADPIRAPARAQDLILRHRVKDYKAGDLEKYYPSLDLEEDILYAYGFVTRELWRLLHPRRRKELTALEKKALAAVTASGEMHPRKLEAALGGGRVINAWGSRSKVTTAALEELQYRGLLRVSRRDKGVKVYAPARPHTEPLSPDERLKGMVLVMAGILAPALEKGLRAYAARRGRWLGVKNAGRTMDSLVREGRLERITTDALVYVRPPGGKPPEPVAPRVRFLAPFDPLVWDRLRFEHFWGWPYRFEAYTPAAKRMRGYYAMPLLWGEMIIGWVNAAVADGNLEIDLGFAGKRPAGKYFRNELEAEISRLKIFLNIKR